MIDYVLVILLIVVMPARALYKGLRGKHDEANRSKTHIQSCAIVVGLLVLLCYAWLHNGRSPALLGLGVPLSARGLIGLAIAAALFVALAVVEIITKRKHQEHNDVKGTEKLQKNNLLPRTRRELTLFLGFALLAGCGWELLYRGFLIWFLVPSIGAVGAVCIAAIAYGAAHGYKSRAQFLGSIFLHSRSRSRSC